ncbi:MAG: efflux RND transporter periplasmic adaptor subunit [Methylomonas sp.]|jgi:multidrug efflux pump subunit AcrA (membrane-fusion protein)|uniref:efflux RND transporter periplasmic adaptor subunit n=1 Tax=Methylomonas sp. TaxID=418 RepID=UPI0025EC054C|nr:efflux RND transporter periplasmic adaptor subunit [Methylomonas sp.]MCK9605400.1 efflux RND transporter periplasmic adaptor subunit [Methylomonas sp.]
MNRLLLVLAGLFLIGCEQAPPPPSQPRPALVVNAGDRFAAAPTILIGEIKSRYESAQGFRIDGKIIQRYVEVGTTVSKGQVLAKLDNRDTGLTVKASEARVQAAKADQALARAELDRLEKLYLRKFISSQAVDIQKAKYQSAVALVKQTVAEAAVSTNQSAYTDLRAERDGVVIEIHAEPGQVVAAGETIARIAVPDSMEVEVSVPESRMQSIEKNLTAEVRLWAEPTHIYQGKIREIAPAADSVTRTFQIRIALTEDASNQLRLGMTAAVIFKDHNHHDFLLPLPAVSQYEGNTVVWVVNPETDQVFPRIVQTGMYREDGVVITKGLQDGDKVVVAGVHTLLSGQKVRPQIAQQNP